MWETRGQPDIYEFDEEAPWSLVTKPTFGLETGCSYGALDPGGNLLEFILPQRRGGAKDFYKKIMRLCVSAS